MKRARFTYLLGLLLGAALPCYSQDVTIFHGGDPTIIVPSMSFELTPGRPNLQFTCGLEPNTLQANVNYSTRWILPGGDIVDSITGRFFFMEGRVFVDNTDVPGTVFILTEMSYQDAGTYTCEGRSTAPGASTQWASASFELQLNLELLSNVSTVNATMNDSTIELHCEMRAFIRPDSFLIWEGPGDQRITGGTGKHQITFSDGSPDAAANGSTMLVPSRVSTLIITDPEPSDAGAYTCRVMGVNNIVVTIDLLVDGFRGIETTDVISTTVTVADINTTRFDTQATSTTANLSDDRTLQVIGIVLGSLAAVTLILAGLLVVAVCGVIHTQNKSRKVHMRHISNKVAEAQQPVYDYIDLPELDHGVDRRYSGLPNQAKQNERDYDVIKYYDPNDEIYDEIRDTREMPLDDTYDSINIVNTTKMNNERIDSEKSGAYEVPIDGDGITTLVTENEVFGVATDGADIDTMKRNNSGATVQDDN